ncbi:MAG: PAS domain S-box protein [Mojavia pulchra JT2-VF2]|jgi:PAS domain S-box-containing protein|uniref:Circadian input-output histidine kinase CikA n=1 Tax=Mojavia pulchra JT2-VF2 TaxID=287848 RepID=A0A951Q3T1_9NOST|nr:PAS domain S-box protein [Mojavia pulchra JT2-VF2]
MSEIFPSENFQANERPDSMSQMPQANPQDALKPKEAQFNGAIGEPMRANTHINSEINQHQSEVHLRQSIEYAPVAIAIFDQQMRYLAVSRKWLEEYSLTNDIIGRSHYEIFPDIPKEWKQIHQQCLAGAIEQRHEDSYLRADGSVEWVRWSLRPWYMASGEIGGIMMFSENITQRKQSEIALRHNEERYRFLVIATSQIVWTVPPDGIVACDLPAWRKFTGQTLNELWGWGWLEAIHPDDRSLTAEAWEMAVKNGSRYEVEHRLRRHDGEYRYMVARGVPVLEADGSIREWVGTHTDIHDRKQAEVALRENNALLRSILESTPDFIVVKDCQGRHVALNSNLANFMGKSNEEIIGKDDTEVLPLEVAREIMAKDQQVIATGMTLTYEENVYHGEISSTFLTTKAPWQDAHGNILGVIATTRNISDRKEVELALQQSEERFRSLIEATSQIVWSTDAEGGFVTDQPQWRAFTGQTVEEIQGWGWLNTIHPEDQKYAAETWLAALAKRTVYEIEVRLRRYDGEYRYLNVRGVPILNADNSVREWVGANIDITERKQAELVLAQAKEAAEAASHAKSEFLANMSHELRTPLNGILGYAQILQRSKHLNEDERSRIDVIYQCGSHLLTLINDILDLSKIEAQKVELMNSDFHFPAFLQGVAEMCRIRAELKGIQFRHQLALELPVAIHADEKRLRQVLINLLSNAIKFTDAGSVTFTISYASEGKIRFEVRDSGVGIPQEKLQAIFQPFEQAGDRRRQTEGTGLGLAISQRIVQLMGSTIQVQSEIGVGSIFWFEVNLPEAQEWVRTSQADDYGQIIGIKDRKPKILVVDDKWENRSVINNLLSPIGFDVTEANDGEQGWQKILEIQPDLVITDLLMPKLDGFELIARIRQSQTHKHIIIIVSSASVFESDQHRSIEAGGDDFMPKPVQAIALFQKLRHYLKLEWIYEEKKPDNESQKDNFELVFPPVAEIEILHELVMKGNFKGIIKQAALITQMDNKYIPFAKQLHQLAKGFQDQEILALLKFHN